MGDIAPARAQHEAGVLASLTSDRENWIRQAASHRRLAELVAGLAPAMREAVLAPVTARDAAAIGARLRPSAPARRERPQRQRAPRPRRVGGLVR